MKTYLLPGKNEIKIDDNEKFPNPSLLFEKFLSVNDFSSENESTENKDKSKESKNKSKELEKLIKKMQPSQDVIKKYNEKMANLETGLKNSGYKLKTEIYKNISPFVVGMGRESAIENGLTFNRNWGIPIIPSSAIKGVIRNYISVFGSDEEIEKVQEYLGSDDDEKPKSGEVNILDAYPFEAKANTFKLDIINNHFGPYYSSDEDKLAENPPNDWYNPIPVFFVVISSNMKFNFSIFGRDEKKIDEVFSWLKRALMEIGIGAKTSVGYGRFKQDKNETRKKEEIRQEKEEKKKLESLSPLEKEFYEIEKSDKEEKIRLTMELYKKIESMQEEDKIKTAKFLEKCWKEIGKWDGKLAKKQKEKVKKIKEILKEN